MGTYHCVEDYRPGHSLGSVENRMDNPLHSNNANYLRLNVERVKEYYDYNGWKGYGLQNDGYDGIPVKAGAQFDFSVFLRNVGSAKQVRVVLGQPQGWGRQDQLAPSVSPPQSWPYSPCSQQLPTWAGRPPRWGTLADRTPATT